MNESDPHADREPSAAGHPEERPTITIRCREHGPLVVELPTGADGPRVGLRVTDHLGVEFPLPSHKRAVALCRCGHSRTRPFCDGSHRETGFSAAETGPASD